MSYIFRYRAVSRSWHGMVTHFKCCLAGALVSLICLAAPQPGHSAEFDAQRQAILNSMYEPGLVLTEQIHRHFWAAFDTSNPNDPKLPGAMARMEAALMHSLEFDRAKARSYQASIKQRKPVIDPGYEQLLQARLELLRARNLSPDGVLAQDKEFRESLIPISKGKPLNAKGGAKVLMTPALVDQILQNLDDSHARLKRLLNPVWVPSAGD